MLVCLVHGYILFLKLRHMCDGLVKFDPKVHVHPDHNSAHFPEEELGMGRREEGRGRGTPQVW